MLNVPKWLASRTFQKDDNEYLKSIFQTKENFSFGDISISFIKEFYLKLERKEFFRLVRVLSFYGVQFVGKLSIYSYCFEDNPRVLKIDPKHWEISIREKNQDNALSLLSYGVNKLKHLHGVPVSSLVKTLYKKNQMQLKPEEFCADIVPVDDSVFYIFNQNQPQVLENSKNKIADNRKGMEILESPVGVLNLSFRARNGLHMANIETIEELVQLTEGELLKLRNFGKKTVKEVKDSLSKTGFTLGLNIKNVTNSSMTKGVDLLDQPIEFLDFSVRTTNCLNKIKIKAIRDLVLRDHSELIQIVGFGRTSLAEIRDKLSIYRLRLGFHQKDIEDWIISDQSRVYEPIKVKSPQLEIKFENLFVLVEDLDIPVRLRNVLNNKNVKYVWEVVQISELDLLSMGNLGRTSIAHLNNVLEGLGLTLGMSFNNEQFEKIKEYQEKKDRRFMASDPVELANQLEDDPLEYLNKVQKTIVDERLWNVSEKSTLEEIAINFGLTRERIRQIEKKTIDKILINHATILRDAVEDLVDKVDCNNGLMVFQDLGIGIESLSTKAKVIIESLIRLQRKRSYIDWKLGLICTQGQSWYENICNSIQSILEGNLGEKQFFSLRELTKAVKIFTDHQQIISKKTRRLLVKKFIQEMVVSSVDGLFSLSRITKQDKAAIAFKKLFPEGLHIYKKRELLYQKFIEHDSTTFEIMSTRAIIALITNSFPKVLLWGIGFLIHKDCTKYDKAITNHVSEWVIERFEEGKSRFTIWLPFHQFEKEIIEAGLPNVYALYSTLRLLNHQRIGLKKFPNIVDINRVDDLSVGISKELENYFIQKDEALSIKDLNNEFVIGRGWKEYRLQQNLSWSEEIYPWRNGTYIHRDKLTINESKLEKLIDNLRNKLKRINGTLSLKGNKNEFSILWEQVCPSATTRTMAKLIRMLEPEDLFIQGDFVSLSDDYNDFSSASAEIEMFVIEQGHDAETHKLQEEFLNKRGWSHNQFYNALNKACIFRSSKNSYIHPSTINWDENLASEVSTILEQYLKGRVQLGQPHVLIEDIIDDYVLPELPLEVQWTVRLIKSVGEEIGEFKFFDESYIAIDNNFEIEDLDDMIGYLISKHFEFNIAKSDDLKRLLWREGIIESGHNIPSRVYYNGSSIEYLENSSEVRLSKLGKIKYANS